MHWSSFFGALAGSVLGALALIGIIVAWDAVLQRRDKERQTAARFPTLDSLLDQISERHLEQHIVADFGNLFPGWRIFDDAPDSVAMPDGSRRPTGIRYRTDAGEIDMLCIDRHGDFVVIEFKVTRAPDRVVSQVDRYVNWVRRNRAQPGQKVRGLIIARALSDHLSHALARRRDIRVWTYHSQLKLNKRPEAAQPPTAEMPPADTSDFMAEDGSDT